MKKKSSWAVTRFVFDHYLAQTRRTLNNETFTAEQRRGQALSLAEALAYVQTLPLDAALRLPTNLCLLTKPL
jgi:hypothetical protein